MRRLTAILASSAVAAATGCFVDTDPPPPIIVDTSGSAIIRWSINGTFDPSQCLQFAVDRLQFTVFTLGGGFVGEFVAPCQDFSTRVDLRPGRYVADAVLVGVGGVATTVVAIDPFTVIGGTDVVLEIDFPASSFF